MKYPYKVSVIIPVYGVEKYIERCAKSLFNQSLDNIEFIFIDDCSKDRSIELLKKIVNNNEILINEKHSSVVISTMPSNSGQAAVRKYGMHLTKGEYTIHCDSDDWVSPDIYKKMYDAAKRNKADIVNCGYYISDGTHSTPIRLEKTRKLQTGPLWNKLVRSSLYKDNEIIYPVCNKAEDGALMVQISYYANNIVNINEPLYYYYQNPDSICHVMSEEAMMKRLDDEIKNTDLRLEFLKREGSLEKFKHDVLIWKKICRDNLKPFLKQKRYRKLWRNIYPEINRQYLFDPSIGLTSKIKFFLNYIGMGI